MEKSGNFENGHGKLCSWMKVMEKSGNFLNSMVKIMNVNFRKWKNLTFEIWPQELGFLVTHLAYEIVRENT